MNNHIIITMILISTYESLSPSNNSGIELSAVMALKHRFKPAVTWPRVNRWALIRNSHTWLAAYVATWEEDDISKRSGFGLSSIGLQACCELGGNMRLVHRDIDKNGNGYFKLETHLQLDLITFLIEHTLRPVWTELMVWSISVDVTTHVMY